MSPIAHSHSAFILADLVRAAVISDLDHLTTDRPLSSNMMLHPDALADLDRRQLLRTFLTVLRLIMSCFRAAAFCFFSMNGLSGSR